ncbi:hypothetical protein BDN70DRAFT_799246 [Pholiota conissans]|uniref:Uncharacterized protein n=1 Tax=Pholiota conissans TaxID=109636 RepID=A0A9P5ZA99_9AGAR|nr:hypothetical protein BDN70DRAFT_799246 [Pholiota conissans]
MRFTVLLSTVVLATMASGLVIPLERRQYDDVLYVREGLGDDMAEYMEIDDAHKNTKNMPEHQSTFHVPGSPANGKPDHTYTGQEVQKAVYESHAEADRLKGASKTQQKKSDLKDFKNYDHREPKTDGNGGAKPLAHMVVDGTPGHPAGKEWPLLNKHDPNTPGPARVITQEIAPGHHVFQGVVAHDQSRIAGTPGYNDHFHVSEHKHTTAHP